MKPMKIRAFKTYQSVRFKQSHKDFFDRRVHGMHNISMILENGFIYLRNHDRDSNGEEELILISVTNVAYMYPLTQSDIDKDEKLGADYELVIQAIQKEKDDQREMYEAKLAELEEAQNKEPSDDETLDDLFTKVDTKDEEELTK